MKPIHRAISFTVQNTAVWDVLLLFSESRSMPDEVLLSGDATPELSIGMKWRGYYQGDENLKVDVYVIHFLKDTVCEGFF